MNRQHLARKAEDEARRRIGRVIDQLIKKYPGEESAVMRVLEGHWQRMLSERDRRK